MKRTLIALTATLSLTAISTPLFAAGLSATANLGVSASVASNCTITTAPVSFGVYDTITGTAVSGTGTVNVACTIGATGLTIDLSTGSNSASASGTTRAMNSAANILNYELFADTLHTSVWSTGYATGDAPSKASRAFTVYGLISANQDVPAGLYSDTVIAKINY
jgi:spore coat protein U-like protein